MHFQLTIILFLCTTVLKSQVSFPFSSTHGSTKETLNIQVKDGAGEKSFLENHMPKGTIYLVSVWATWCGSCRGELKAIQKVHCDWSEKYNFEFLAVSVDTPTDHSKVFALANKMDWNFKVLHDEYGYLVRELEVSRLPRLFLVNQEGNIVYESEGFNTIALRRIEKELDVIGIL